MTRAADKGRAAARDESTDADAPALDAADRGEREAVAAAVTDGRFITLDLDGRVAGWSRAAEATFGYSRRDVLGAGFVETLLHEDERGSARERLDAMLERSGAGANLLVELDTVTSAGERLRASFAIVPIGLAVSYEFNAMLRGIATGAGSQGSIAEVKARHDAVLEMIDAALEAPAGDGEVRLAGALIAFDAGEPPRKVVAIADARPDAGLDPSEDELKELYGQLEEARHEARRARNDADVARQEVSDAHESLAVAQRETDAARRALEEARHDGEQLRIAAEASRIRHEDKSKEADELRDRLLEAQGAARTIAERLEGEISDARADAARASAELEEARAELVRHAAELDAAQAELGRLADAFERSPTATILTTLDGRAVRMNRAARDTLGYGLAEASDPDGADAVVHPDDLAGRRELMRQLVRGDVGHATGERRYLDSGGEPLQLRERAALVRDRRGDPSLFVLELTEVEGADAGRRARGEIATGGVDDAVAGGTSIAPEALREAIEGDGMTLYCQPVLDLRTGEVEQFELLLRLRTGDGRVLLPESFLGPARRLGLARTIDRWVVGEALRLLGADPDGEHSVEVNLSPEATRDPGLGGLIDEELARTGVDPARLVLELAGASAMADLGATRDLARRLRARGCRFGVDDFRSSLSFRLFRELPIDLLKLEGELVGSLAESRTAQLVAKALVDVAAGTGMKTVAVFVTDERTLELLREHGVDYAQGYIVGRPRPVAEVWPGGQ